MLFFVVLGVVMVLLVILYVLSPLVEPETFKIPGSHVLITGGSSGIGKSLAIEIAKKGANITLVARNQNKLAETRALLEDYIDKDKQKIVCVSVDVCKDYVTLEKALSQARDINGPVGMVVNCAGTSVPGRFDELPIDTFRNLMDVNYIGSVNVTRAVMSDLKSNTNSRIVFVSSQAGQIGIYGFSAYSASKFALRGLAEALQMEVKPYNVHVTVAFPPDTDTPGLAEENKGKPKETSLISATSGLFKPEQVAKSILNDAVKGKFYSYIGLDGYMLYCCCSGMSPVISIMEAAQQVVLCGFFRLISFFYLDSFDRIVKKCKDEKTD